MFIQVDLKLSNVFLKFKYGEIGVRDSMEHISKSIDHDINIIISIY